MRPTRQPTGAVTAAALVAAGIAAACAIGEVGTRLLWRPPSERAPQRQPPPPELSPITGGILGLAAANAEGLYRGVPFRNNSAGFRGREFSPQPPAATLRIAIAGDSFTMGDGVPAEDAYPQRLEVLLRRRGCGDVEVLNFGLAGLDIRQIAQRARKLGGQFHPHVLVYGLTVNDIEGPAYRQVSSPLVITQHNLRYRARDESPSYLLRLLWPRLLSLRELLHPSPGSYTYELLQNYFANPEAWSDFTGGLDEIAELGRTLERPPVVFVHTVLVHLNRFHPLRPIYFKVGAAAAERGLPVIQSLPHHYGRSSHDLWVDEDDSHPNAVGHRLLAEALAEGLERIGYLASCPSSR